MVRLSKRGEEIRQFILENVQSHPTDIIGLTADSFDVSRQAISKHIRELLLQEALTVSGNTKNRRFSLAPIQSVSFVFALDSKLREDVVWSKDISPLLSELPDNVRMIWQHGFTEMLNNAIDHSGGATVAINLEKTAVTTRIMIQDDGEGIFKKIMRELGLDDEKHAPLELGKGKFTTDPENHSGEGIFFSSRMFDTFMIISHSVVFSHDFDADLELIGEHNSKGFSGGTTVAMYMKNNSSRTIQQVFRQYTTGDCRFSKTIIPVRLAQYGNDLLVSRSQAKRLLAGLEKFEMVCFDFAKVDFIGQGFADEVFRVFSFQHPEITITFLNANREVSDAIRRVDPAGGRIIIEDAC